MLSRARSILSATCLAKLLILFTSAKYLFNLRDRLFHLEVVRVDHAQAVRNACALAVVAFSVVRVWVVVVPVFVFDHSTDGFLASILCLTKSSHAPWWSVGGRPTFDAHPSNTCLHVPRGWSRAPQCLHHSKSVSMTKVPSGRRGAAIGVCRCAPGRAPGRGRGWV